MFYLLAIPVAAIVAGAAYLSRLPSEYTLRRSQVIKADRQTVFDKIRDTPSWGEWSPWLMHEPDAKLDFSANPGQEGGSYSWDGKYIGAGTLTHTKFHGKDNIDQIIAFRRPFKAKAEVGWEFADAEGGTEVTWSMKGGVPFALRPMIPSMTKMIGNDYALGLARLRGCLEPDAERPLISFDGETNLAPINALTVPFSGPREAMVKAMQDGFPKLAAHISEQGKQPTGMPLTAYHKGDIRKMLFDCDIAIPAAPDVADGSFLRKTFAGGKHFKVGLQGKYDFLELAWHAAMCHVKMYKLKIDKSRPMLEIYENDPETVANSNEICTSIYIPLKGTSRD